MLTGFSWSLLMLYWTLATVETRNSSANCKIANKNKQIPDWTTVLMLMLASYVWTSLYRSSALCFSIPAFSNTLVNNVSRLASHICLAVSYRFFIAAVRSMEILPQFYSTEQWCTCEGDSTAWCFLSEWKQTRPTIKSAIKQCVRQQRMCHQATNQSASRVQNRQHQKKWHTHTHTHKNTEPILRLGASGLSK